MPLSAWTLLPLSQISPPQVRVPITGPIWKRWKPSAKASPSEAVCLIAEDDDVAAESTLHVPLRLADTRLPVEPGLAKQFAEKPGVDVAAFVVADVDDETLAIEDGVVLAGPLIDVVRAHGAQMDVADVAGGGGLDFEPAGVLPLGVAQVVFVFRTDGSCEELAGFAPFGFDAEEDLFAGLAAQEFALIGDAEKVCAVDGEDGFAFGDGGIRAGEGWGGVCRSGSWR